jgi:hypothetical protein
VGSGERRDVRLAVEGRRKLEQTVDDGDSIVLFVFAGGELVQIDLNPPLFVDNNCGAVTGANRPEDQTTFGRGKVIGHACS